MSLVVCRVSLALTMCMACLAGSFNAMAQTDSPPKITNRRIGGITPIPDQTVADLGRSHNCVDVRNLVLNAPDRWIKSSQSLILTYVVVQTWFSTEPLVLPAANFVFSGNANYVWQGNGTVGTFYPSSPTVNFSDPPSVTDSINIYDQQFDLVPYYSASPKPDPGPHSCPSQYPIPYDPSQSPLLQSKVPLAFRNFKPHTFVNGAMFLLRPYILPNATSVSFADQVGINGTPRWSLTLAANPVLGVFFDRHQMQTRPLNYLTLNINVNLNNQINANPNSTIGAIAWNMRSNAPLQRGIFFNCNSAHRGQWLRKPELDVDLTGAEYDFVSNDVNLYYPSPSVKFPLAVLDKNGVPAVFVWKLQLGEESGLHIRNPSADLAGRSTVFPLIENEGDHLFRGLGGAILNVNGWGASGWDAWLSGFSINSNYQVRIPITDEPFTIPSSTSSKPPTVTLTDKARHYVRTTIGEKLGNSNFSLGVTYQYGELPPAFWLVKHSLSASITLSSGTSRAE